MFLHYVVLHIWYYRPDSYHNYAIYFDSVFKLMICGSKKCESATEHDESELWTRYSSFNGEQLKPDDSIELCISFVHRCQTNEMGSYKLRGPYLAVLLLYKKLTEHGYDPVKYLGTRQWKFDSFFESSFQPIVVDVSGNLGDLFENYFQLFADKPCCFKDLYQFLPLIENDCESLLSSTWRLIEEIGDNEIKTVRNYDYSDEYLQWLGTNVYKTCGSEIS